MKGYKGFNKDLKCRDKQYEIGETYEEEKAKLCKEGLHFCEYPLDAFYYYPPSDSRYAEVEAEEVDDETGNDSKRACKKLSIKSELSIKGIIEASVKFILEKVDYNNKKESNTGDRSAATNTGDQSAATNTGWQSAAANTGALSAATNTGDHSAAANTGDRSAAANTGALSAATNTGGQSAAANTGDYSAATNTGIRSAATNTGYGSAATNTGDYSAATVKGKNSIALSMGIEGKASGALGCYIVLAEWKQDKKGGWKIKTVETARVDGKRIKPDTFYILKDGKFVEEEAGNESDT